MRVFLPARALQLIPCLFHVWTHWRAHVRHTARQFVGLLCSTYLCSRKKHNRAKPMSELLSALISIADSSEFRFARFNIVYEGAQLVLPESPPIVSGVSDMRPPGVQTWKRHGIRCSHPAGKIARIFLQRMFHRHSTRNRNGVLLIILLIYYLSLKEAIHGKRQPIKHAAWRTLADTYYCTT